MRKNNLRKRMREVYGIDLSHELNEYKFLCGESKRKYKACSNSFKQWDEKIEETLKTKSKTELYEINRILEIILVQGVRWSEFAKGAGTALFSVILGVCVTTIAVSDSTKPQMAMFLMGIFLLVFLAIFSIMQSFIIFKNGSIDVKMYHDIIRLVKKLNKKKK